MKGAFWVALERAVEASGIEAHVTPSGASIRISDRCVADPDAAVYISPEAPYNSLSMLDPITVVEVLSDFSCRHDIGRKLEAYFALPSVRHYIIADPDEPLLFHHSRTDGGAILTRIIRDATTPLVLDPPGLSLDLSETFDI